MTPAPTPLTDACKYAEAPAGCLWPRCSEPDSVYTSPECVKRSIDDLRSKLADTEAKYQQSCSQWRSQFDGVHARAMAAEARVKALEEALTEIRAHSCNWKTLGNTRSPLHDVDLLAAGALSPVTTKEKDNG